ncbi:MAG: hypothetical protein L0229_07690 [Blastocatellia bacterium]|nr:hypothetical protein [Blastocatellia bacterium]
MSRRRRTEITVETTEILVVRKSGRARLLWCAECCRQVEMITPEQAMIVAGTSSRTIYRSVEAGQIHYSETPEGFLFICLNSLTA